MRVWRVSLTHRVLHAYYVFDVEAKTVRGAIEKAEKLMRSDHPFHQRPWISQVECIAVLDA